MWVRVATTSDGVSRLLPENHRGELRIAGSDFFFTADSESPEVARLDSTQRPKAIDLTPTGETAGPLRGKTYFGIYEVEGDTLMMGLDIYHESKRPREFATKGDPRTIIDLYRRIKP